MHKAVREEADRRNIKRLKYIFADCLDVDPTFEQYKEDYEYCQKHVPELFEMHKDITPLIENPKDWNHDYWIELKIDLVNNFSKKRFEHMRKVANVIYAEKIKFINEKRETEAKKIQNATWQKTDNTKKNNNNVIHNKINNVKYKTKEENDRELMEAREQLEREKEMERQQQQIIDMKTSKKISGQNIRGNRNEDDSLKKLMGLLLGIVILLVIVMILLSQ